MEKKKPRGTNYTLKVGVLLLPIKLHTATSEHKAKRVMISNCCGGEVGYSYKCKTCGASVNRGETTKRGYPFGGQVVVLEKGEVEAILSETTKTVEVIGFTPSTVIDLTKIGEKRYHISPNTDIKKGGSVEGGRFFGLLLKVLALTDTVAVGRYVRNGYEHIFAIKHYNGGLILQELLWADQIKPQPQVEIPTMTEREEELAKELVAKMTTTFELEKFEDTFQRKLEKLLEARALGQPFEVEKPQPKATESVEKMLEQMVAVA